ncbi:MAG: hypothetical protein AB7V39_19945 [Nitrospiraceae bacterium]
MNLWKYHHEFNAMPLGIADSVRVSGIISLGDECVPISTNPANLYLSAYYLARAEKARMLCDLGKSLLERRRTQIEWIERRISRLDRFIDKGVALSLPCSETNALAIRTRRKPLRVTRKNLRDYLLDLRESSMPHEVDAQFQFFVGDFGEHLVLYVTENLHYLKLSICSGVLFESMPYPYLDYLCQDALGNNQIFLKTAE